MSNPTAVSDIERAEHLGYGESKGVKRVSIFNDGVQTNVATSEKQDSLLTELQKKADLTETQPVSAASLPLPSGAATAAKQDTQTSAISLKPGYDTVDVNISDPESIVITKKLSGVTVDTKTVTITS